MDRFPIRELERRLCESWAKGHTSEQLAAENGSFVLEQQAAAAKSLQAFRAVQAQRCAELAVERVLNIAPPSAAPQLAAPEESPQARLLLRGRVSGSLEGVE